MVTRAERWHIRTVFEWLFDSRAGYEAGPRPGAAGVDEETRRKDFARMMRPHNYAASLRRTGYYRRALGIARQVLGPSASFTGEHMLMKAALNGPEIPWRQDEAFRSEGTREISISMPLQAVDEANGCMRFIPGSHLGPVLRHRSPGNDPRIRGLECCEGFDEASAVACPLPAGGVTVHAGRTLHASGANRSSAARYSYVLNFAVPIRFGAPAGYFPWLEEKETARRERFEGWLNKSGGVFYESWCVVRRIEEGKLGRLLARMFGKGRAMRPVAQEK
jgi:hypothetical protein